MTVRLDSESTFTMSYYEGSSVPLLIVISLLVGSTMLCFLKLATEKTWGTGPMTAKNSQLTVEFPVRVTVELPVNGPTQPTVELPVNGRTGVVTGVTEVIQPKEVVPGAESAADTVPPDGDNGANPAAVLQEQAQVTCVYCSPHGRKWHRTTTCPRLNGSPEDTLTKHRESDVEPSRGCKFCA